MDSKICLSIATLLMLALCASSIQPMSHIKEDEKENYFQRQLSRINKPSLGSFKTNYGIIDCIDIYKQSAFDNPLLKDHQIQMRPSYLQSQEEQQKPEFGNFTHHIGIGVNCPDGTVPIRRTTMKDLIRWNLSSGQPQDFYPFNEKNKKNNYALVKFKKADQPYTSAQAFLGNHQPKVKAGEKSGVQLWIYGENDQGNNYVSVGWMVDPDMYGDYFSHLTIYWKGDGMAGCANMQCSGFVQTSNHTPLGWILDDISTPKHPSSYPVKIFRDDKTGHWWLETYNDGELTPLGYWPNKLFSQLDKGSSAIACGGITRAAKPNAIVPPMGTGIADCNIRHTAFIYNIQYKLGSDKMMILPSWTQAETKVDCPDVYKIQHNDQCKRKYDTFYFMYGGPGGSIC